MGFSISNTGNSKANKTECKIFQKPFKEKLENKTSQLLAEENQFNTNIYITGIFKKFKHQGVQYEVSSQKEQKI